MFGLLRSVLVEEETDSFISLRSACGSRRAAAREAFVIWRIQWFPHRWYGFSKHSDWDGDDPFANWTEKGWRWRRHTFWVKTRPTGQ